MAEQARHGQANNGDDAAGAALRGPVALVPRSPALPLVAEVAVAGGAGTAGDGVLSYAVPESLRAQSELRRGQVVWVPLRKQVVLGIVQRLHDEAPAFAMKPLQAAVAPPIVLSEDQLALGAWLAHETAATRYAALARFLPPGLTRRIVHYLELTGTSRDRAHAALTPTQRKLVELIESRGELTLETARVAMKSSLKSVVEKLAAAGVLRVVPRVAEHAPHPTVQRFIRVTPAGISGSEPPGERQREVLRLARQQTRLAKADQHGLLAVSPLLMQAKADQSVIVSLARRGLVEEIFLPRQRTPVDEPAPAPVPLLTAAQAAAWRAIEARLVSREPTPFLLHGVTGSGKTEVYLRAVAWCLRHGRGAIVLVPEIALATQVVRRFIGRFPGQVAVLHSAMTDTERLATWQAIAEGRYQVVVGPRSALFAPVTELGVIIVDEEHDSAYKQDVEPRYHTRAVAEHLATERGAVVVLGSATPAVETFWRSTTGEVTRLELPDRVGPDLGGDDGPTPLALPSVEIVDMRLELHRGNTSLFSEALQEVLARTIAAREQALLFLNRRGLATVVLCKDCGHRLLCPYCDIPLVYHADRRQLLCHRCDYRAQPPPACPDCGGNLNYFGAGTQRVEQELRRHFPDARIMRWDQDAARGKDGHARLLRRIERHEVDLVVGTQMIAKGLDLPLVTAIGVIHADTMLYLPDFRAGERTFQLLTQVAGRAGRRTAGASVVIQSYAPDHYAIQAAARHDYAAFYAEEIDFRRVHHYPPFTRLIRYLFRDSREERCAVEADAMARALARHARQRGLPMDLLGPAPAFVGRIRGQYQWQIVLRAPDLSPLLDGLPNRPGWIIDVDPQSLL